MPPPEAAQEGAQGGWRLDHAAENTVPVPPARSALRDGVVDEVAARQAEVQDQRQQFVPRVRPPRGAAEVEVMADEFPQAQVKPVQGCAGRSRPALATRRRSSKTTRITGRIVSAEHLTPSTFPGGNSTPPKPFSQIQRSTLASSGLSPKSSFGGFGLKRWNEKRSGKSAPEKRPGVTV